MSVVKTQKTSCCNMNQNERFLDPTIPDETDNMAGTTDTQTKAVARTYTGFTAQAFEQKPQQQDSSFQNEQALYLQKQIQEPYLLNSPVQNI